MNTLEHNKAQYRRFIDVIFNEGRIDQLPEFVTSNYVLHDGPPGTPPGAEAIRQIVTQFRAAFPDLKITIEDQVAEGDKVCSRATTRGTHRGTMFGIPPTGRAVAMSGLTLVRFVDGRVSDSWVKNDVAGLMAQLRAT